MSTKKKGMIRKNVLGLVIAVIGLLLIILAITKIYYIIPGNESENAKKTVETLKNKIDSIDNGEQSSVIIQGFDGSNNWYLIGWNKGDINGPDKCLLKNCLCICSVNSKGERDEHPCQKAGFCEFWDDKELIVYSNFSKVEGHFVTGGDINTFGAKFECIVLNSNLMKIEVKKTDKKIYVSREVDFILEDLEENGISIGSNIVCDNIRRGIE